MSFLFGSTLGLFLGLIMCAVRIRNMDWYYTQDREKRLKDLDRLNARITELDHRLRQRIHKEVIKAKRSDNVLAEKVAIQYGSLSTAFKAINELQARGRMHGIS